MGCVECDRCEGCVRCDRCERCVRCDRCTVCGSGGLECVEHSSVRGMPGSLQHPCTLDPTHPTHLSHLTFLLLRRYSRLKQTNLMFVISSTA